MRKPHKSQVLVTADTIMCSMTRVAEHEGAKRRARRRGEGEEEGKKRDAHMIKRKKGRKGIRDGRERVHIKREESPLFGTSNELCFPSRVLARWHR